MILTAQVSLYPLRQVSIGQTIRKAVRLLRGQGLGVQVGAMSTLIWGEEQAIFSALQRAFHQAAEDKEVVMVVTISNGCPSPEKT